MKIDDLMKEEMKRKIEDLRRQIQSFQEENADFDGDLDNLCKKALKLVNEYNPNFNLFDEDFLTQKSRYNVFSRDRMIDMGINGNAMMNNYMTRIHLFQNKTCWGRLMFRLNMIFDKLVPFQNDIRYILSRYDRNVSGIFEFSRFVFLFKTLLMLVVSFLLINHIIVHNSNSDQTWCSSYIPCFLYYSRFGEEEAFVFSITYIAIIFILFFGVLYKWSISKKHNLLEMLFDDENTHYSKVVLNPVNWANDSQRRLDNAKFQLKNILSIGVRESEIK